MKNSAKLRQNKSLKHKAAHILILTLIFYAGFLAALYGILELARGAEPTNGMAIQAIAPPCDADKEWHACFTAMTIFGTYDTAGMVTLILTGLLITRGIRHINHPKPDMALLILPMLLFLSGGGFTALFILIIAGVTAYWPSFKLPIISINLYRFLARGWPWLLFLYFIIVGAEALFGGFGVNPYERINLIVPAQYILLGLTAAAAHCWDIVQQSNK